MNKKFLAKLLALALVLTMVPATILAASATTEGSDNTCPDSTCPDSTCPGGSTSSVGDSYVDTTVRVDTTVPEDGAVEVKVVNGTAKVALSEKAVESLAELVEDDEIVLEIKAENATKIDVSLSAKALASVAAETGADLTIKSSVATITIPNEALSTELGTGTLRVSAQSNANGVSFSIQASGKALKSIKGLVVQF